MMGKSADRATNRNANKSKKDAKKRIIQKRNKTIAQFQIVMPIVIVILAVAVDPKPHQIVARVVKKKKI